VIPVTTQPLPPLSAPWWSLVAGCEWRGVWVRPHALHCHPCRETRSAWCRGGQPPTGGW